MGYWRLFIYLLHFTCSTLNLCHYSHFITLKLNLTRSRICWNISIKFENFKWSGWCFIWASSPPLAIPSPLCSADFTLSRSSFARLAENPINIINIWFSVMADAAQFMDCKTRKKARVTCLLFTRIREIRGEVGGDSLSSHRARHLLLGPGLALSQMSQMSPVCPRARVLGSVTVNLSWSQPAEPPGLSELNKQTSNTKDLDNHNAMLWIENKSTLFKSRCLLKIRLWGST